MEIEGPSVSQRLNVGEAGPLKQSFLGRRSLLSFGSVSVVRRDSIRKSSRPSFVRPYAATFSYGDVRVRNFTIILENGEAKIVDDRQPDKKFDDVLTNAIHTTRFHWYNAIPLSIWFQFYRIANIYFAVVAILALIFVRGSAVKTFVVATVMMLQTCKDLYEDHKRGADDQEENSRPCHVYKHIHCQQRQWADIRLGSVVKVKKGELIPADLLIIASSDPSGSFFLSTKSLDGETNLKQRGVPAAVQEYIASTQIENGNAPPEQHLIGTWQDMGTALSEQDLVAKIGKGVFRVRLEPPQENLLSMECSIELGSVKESVGLGLDNFALRGCDLQNTNWVVGIACYAGHATKIMINSSGAPSKQSDLEKYLNKSVVGIVLSIGVASILFAIAEKVMEVHSGDNCKFDGKKWTSSCNAIEVLIKFVVMLWAVLPVTLYIIFEILHLLFARQINLDDRMQDPITGKFAKTRNSSIIEDLGQVSYVFSDKTGTLTANDMRFKHCYVGGCKYGPFALDESLDSFASGVPVAGVPAGLVTVQNIVRHPHKVVESKDLVNFFTMLAICHTVRMDENFDAECSVETVEDRAYQAESPDELALVLGAKQVGFAWIGRERCATGQASMVDRILSTGKSKSEFIVSHDLPFSSDRKRMSVVITQDDGGALVWTKGADSIMKDLVREFPKDADAAIHEFAVKGLRTLVFGHRRMNAAEYTKWRRWWEQASAHVPASKYDVQRAEKLEQVYRDAETGLTFSGIAALEDRLQDHVPDTIARLRAADVHVWVLTGDKVETAVEIAKACRLFEGNVKPLYVVEARNPMEAMWRLDQLKGHNNKINAGLVLDGQSLSHILNDDEAKLKLYELARRTSSCLCCRLSPLQKRKLVELVRYFKPEAVTLAIGDGANDVPMIQGAHIGIGIRGKEGGASVQASDFAISQFRFLGNLMFVHGRKSYRRLSTFLGYFIYKSIAIGWPYIIHAFVSNFRGDTPVSPILDALYAPLTSWSVALMVAFDEDFADDEVLQSDDIRRYYDFGPRRSGWNVMVLLQWMLVASVHGIVGWYWTIWLVTRDPSDWSHQNRKFWGASITAFSTIIIIVHLKLVFLQNWKVGPGGAVRFLGLLVALGELLCYAVGVAIASVLVSNGTLRLKSIMQQPGSECGNPFAPFCEDCTCEENIVVEGLFTNSGLFYCCLYVVPAVLAYELLAGVIRITCCVDRQRYE